MSQREVDVEVEVNVRDSLSEAADIPDGSMKAQSYSSAIAVERSADILFLLADRGETSLSDIARTIGASASAVHRILLALRRKGLVEQVSATEHYDLAWGVLTLARSRQERANVRAVALPHMAYLRDLTRETITLNVRWGFQRVCVEQIESPNEVRWRNDVGRIDPLYVGATGKILLAQLPPPELKRYFAAVKLRQLAPNTITDRATLERVLEKARRQGFATAHQERSAGVAGIAAPILDRRTGDSAALLIGGPAERCADDVLLGWAPALLSATRSIAAELS